MSLFLPLQLSGSSLQDSLANDIEDGRLNHFSLIEAAFIISGATTPQELDENIWWFKSIRDDIRDKQIIDDFEKVASAEKLFLYLHTTWLEEYQEEATTLLDIRMNRKFNCVSATILYNLTCDEFGLNTMAFETPTHVYTIFTNFTENIMVENTTSIGFNIIQNLDNYSRYMARYYPGNQMYRIGLHRLYAYENSKGRRITNLELLGLISYNQAYFSTKEKRYAEAYEFVLLAQSFNHDSRSNQRFEINLYYQWGNQLHRQLKHNQSFTVFADAVYRYPDNKDFINNCLVSFFSALQQLWADKDWKETRRLVNEIKELEILNDSAMNDLAKIMLNWTHHFYLSRQKENGEDAIDLQNKMGIKSKKLKQLEKAIASLGTNK